MKWLMVVFLLLICVSPAVYFLYCLEKKKRWAQEFAEVIAHIPGGPFL